ncbi:MAG: hypothetical protein GC159_01375 [Phycisphaera sp.]|nr:hypothetical protein [Phycisphaera sp.]
MTQQPPNADSQTTAPAADDELVVPQAAAAPRPAAQRPPQDPRLQPDPLRPHRCVDCKRYFAPQEIVNYKGDLVCYHCLEHGPPGMDPRKKQSIMMVGLAMMPIIVFGSFLLYRYVLREPIQRALKPQTYAQQQAAGVNGEGRTNDVGDDPDVKPTYTIEQLDAAVAQLLRADSIGLVEVPAGPDTLSEMIKNVAPHREAWGRFAKLPTDHAAFLHTDLASWSPQPKYIDIVLRSTSDRWGDLRDTLGPAERSTPVSQIDKPVTSLTLVPGDATTSLHKFTGTTWVRYGYLELVLSTDSARGYVRGIRLHVQKFLDSHVPVDSVDPRR